MTPQSSAVFLHSPTPWTVGDLRQSLDGLPPDATLAIYVATSPGREAWEEQVVVGLWKPEALNCSSRIAIILADMPAGLYLRAAEQ
ncbi:DUF6225 family protein [Streptomyces sp. NPDC086182]|jgi:hypothetical protein|uniref:DUF6225 family protein n=1 Tax=Streptomyces sp. NPDC086182 TaxID=3155058 RepID=UPI00341CB63E